MFSCFLYKKEEYNSLLLCCSDIRGTSCCDAMSPPPGFKACHWNKSTLLTLNPTNYLEKTNKQTKKGSLNASYMQPVDLLARGLWRFVVRPGATVLLSGEPVEELMPAVKISPHPSSMFTFRAFNLSAPQWNVQSPSTMTVTVPYWSVMLKWCISRVWAEFPSHSLALYYHFWGQNKWCQFSL